MRVRLASSPNDFPMPKQSYQPRHCLGRHTKVSLAPGPTEAWHSLPETLFWWDLAGQDRVRKIFDFCLDNNSLQGIRKTFSWPWRGICTFGEGICSFWQELARLDGKTRWQGKNMSKLRENVDFFFSSMTPRPGLTHFFIAETSYRN